jgi:hypothetical protein
LMTTKVTDQYVPRFLALDQLNAFVGGPDQTSAGFFISNSAVPRNLRLPLRRHDSTVPNHDFGTKPSKKPGDKLSGLRATIQNKPRLKRGLSLYATRKERNIMAVEFLWNAAFWKTTAGFAPIVATGVALAAAIIALCAIRAQRDTAIRIQLH